VAGLVRACRRAFVGPVAPGAEREAPACPAGGAAARLRAALEDVQKVLTDGGFPVVALADEHSRHPATATSWSSAWSRGRVVGVEQGTGGRTSCSG
jgi:hypothetical protein